MIQNNQVGSIRNPPRKRLLVLKTIQMMTMTQVCFQLLLLRHLDDPIEVTEQATLDNDNESKDIIHVLASILSQ